MMFREIDFGGEDYRRECALRQAVLRAPLGLDLYAEDLEKERQELHFGLFDEDDQLHACAIAIPLQDARARIRQMAVSANCQGQGLGRKLLEEIEKQLLRRGFSEISLHARLSAAGFYEQLGYDRASEVFTEVGLPHVRMQKSLIASQGPLP